MAKKRRGKKKKKAQKKKVDNRIPWDLVLAIEKEVEWGFYTCPICQTEVPGSKRNLRGHLRSTDHTKAEAVSWLVSWSDYYDEKGTDPGMSAKEAEVKVEMITGTTIRLRLNGNDIVAKIRQHDGAEPSAYNFHEIEKAVIADLVEHLTRRLADEEWLPLGDEEE